MSIRHAIVAGAAMALLSSAAQATITYGNADATTGTNWIKATTLAEGQAQGFRAATTDEFSAYLTHGGFGAPSATQEFFSRTVLSPRMGFATDTYVPPSMIYEYAGPGVTLGLLDGKTTQVGAIMSTTGRQQSPCYPGDYSYQCYSTIYVNEAAFGSLSEMEAGQHDRYSYGVGGDWKGALSNLKQPDGGYKLSYFMVSVPEPSTWMMLSLGLVGAGLARRRATRTGV